MRNIRLKLAYDGTDFHGFQIQPEVRTVQGAVENALWELTRERIRLIAAGRTDEGVHALGQVVNFKTSSKMSPSTLERALNAKLPPDIVASEVEDADSDFHARYSAKSRTYEYSITRIRSPFIMRYAWLLKYDINMSAMSDAARTFSGAHDFAGFCVAKSRVDETECVVYSSGWRIEGHIFKYEVVANRFLHNMVRIMVGTMVELGRGKLKESDLASMLKTRDRREAGPTAPPHGLFLMRVKY